LYLREDWNKKANRNVYSVASTIDGFRIVAARQATYEGQTAPQWCDKNGKWSEVWAADAPPVAARIGVYVRGYREPMWGIARFNEYKPEGSGGFMWLRMASHMIAKVAEALAIRKAYPDQLSGVYTDDEMQQADARREEQASGDKPGRQQQHRAPRGNNEYRDAAQAIAKQQDADAEASQDPQDRPAEHHQGPVEDQWNTATGQPLAPPSPSIPSASDEQIGEIVRLLGVKRSVYEDACAPVVSKLVQRRIDHPRTLSQAEARSIIETLTAEPDLVPLPTAPAAASAPAEPPTDRPGPGQMKAMHALLHQQGHTKDGGHVLMSRITGRTITSANDLTAKEASAVIKTLNTGEIPAPSAPEPPGPNANGEGISEFDALDQMILEVHDQQSQMDAEDAIAAELNRGSITETGAGVLRGRLAAHVEREQAGASA
jgi:hypothetical protein